MTRPYKVEIVPHLDVVDEEAALAGSVNTVVVEGERLRGLSTDGVGVTAPLERHLRLEGASVVVLGAGGAARAAAYALRKKGAAVTLLARDPEKAAEAARAIGCDYGALASAGERPFDAVINATPLGGGRATPASRPGRPRPIARGSVAFDMVYDPRGDAPLARGASGGCCGGRAASRCCWPRPSGSSRPGRACAPPRT